MRTPRPPLVAARRARLTIAVNFTLQRIGNELPAVNPASRGVALTVAPRLGSGGESSLDRHACRCEINASSTTPCFYEDRGLVHLPQCHACGVPRHEVFGNGYLPALPSRLPDTPELLPSRDARAKTGAGHGLRIQDVRIPINGDCALVGSSTNIDRHCAERVFDDVVFNTWVYGPPIDSYIGISGGGSCLCLGELGGNRSQLVVRLGVVPY